MTPDRFGVYNSDGRRVGDCESREEAETIVEQCGGSDYAVIIGNRVQQLPGRKIRHDS